MDRCIRSGAFVLWGIDSMTFQKYKRKLTAVFSADVVGYSRLMGDDEAETVKTLEAHKRIMFSLIKQHRGRVVDSPGDNLLAEFVSVVDAVGCGLNVQNDLKVKNADLPVNRRMQFRIGINLGDVIEEESRIYGDGVNIAARLEGLAEAGGICISGTVFDQVKNKLPVGYQYLGKQTVKHIADPLRTYKVLMEPEAAGKVIGEEEPRQTKWGWKVIAAVAVLILLLGGLVWNFHFRSPPIEPASLEKMAFPLPDKPSIAVLPFTNMSGDPRQGFFGDGLTEDLITALSKVPNIFVVARNSTFTYKDKPVKVQKVAEDLGVRYVLEGGFQKAGDRVRITAQLIDALKGYHLWSEQYDREMKDIFAVQDKITLQILKALDVKLTYGEGGRFHGRGTNNLEVYLKFLQARDLVLQFNRESNFEARRLAEEVISLDPHFPSGYHTLASVITQEVWLGISKSPKKAIMKATKLEQKAISLDDSYAPSHASLGVLYMWIREYEKGIAEGKRAIEIAPNLADAHVYLAQSLNCSGRPEEALSHIETAFRLNPVGPPSYYYIGAAHTYRLLGRYADGVKMYKALLSRWPNNVVGYVGLAMNYAALGQDDEARAAALDVLRIDPKFSAQRDATTTLYKDPAQTARALELMRKAGLPD